jgi:hypothetical protein
MERNEIEKLAFKLAPPDTHEDPAYPNCTDTDIWVNGFVAGYQEKEKEEKELIKLFNLANSILHEHPNMALTGTLMLLIRGIDLGRIPSDLDFVFNEMSESAEFLNLEYEGVSSDGKSVKYKYGDIKVDFLQSEEKHEVVNGWRLGSLNNLISAKQLYSYQNNSPAEKHREDLEKIRKQIGHPNFIIEECIPVDYDPEPRKNFVLDMFDIDT